MQNDIQRRLLAEFFGTFWLVFGGCGSAVLSAAFPQLGIGFLGVSFAFGLTVLTVAYAVGHVSGEHFKPAVTLGLWAAGRCANKHVLPYMVVQVVGAVLAAGVLWTIAAGKPGRLPGGFAADGYGALSPGEYSMMAGFTAEVLLSFFFVLIIVGTTSKGAATGFAGIPVGLALVLIADPPDLDPHHQHLGQPGAQYRPGAVRRRRLYRPALAVPGGPDPRRHDRRRPGARPLRAVLHRRDHGGRGTWRRQPLAAVPQPGGAEHAR
jgi:aquaporin Z